MFKLITRQYSLVRSLKTNISLEIKKQYEHLIQICFHT